MNWQLKMLDSLISRLLPYPRSVGKAEILYKGVKKVIRVKAIYYGALTPITPPAAFTLVTTSPSKRGRGKTPLPNPRTRQPYPDEVQI